MQQVLFCQHFWIYGIVVAFRVPRPSSADNDHLQNGDRPTFADRNELDRAGWHPHPHLMDSLGVWTPSSLQPFATRATIHCILTSPALWNAIVIKLWSTK